MTDPVDHRPRVAAARRDRMRAHLLRSALRAALGHGTVAVPLEDLLAAADVSRATFYKYFADVPAAMRAMGVALADELIRHVDLRLERHDDPAERLAIGLTGILRLVRQAPALGELLAHMGWPLADTGDGHAFDRLVRPDVERGLRQRRFARIEPALATEMVAGLTIAAAHRLARTPDAAGLIEQATSSMLRALGVAPDDARMLAKVPRHPMPAPEEDSMLALLAAAAATGEDPE